MKKLHVLQLICPTGFYGAERWVLALAHNLDADAVRCDLAVTRESKNQDLEIVNHYPSGEGQVFEVEMSGRFDLRVVSKLCALIKKRDIDVIHTHGYKSDILGLLAARVAGVNCVSTPHGFGEPTDFKLKVFIRIGAFCLRFFDTVAPLSRQLMDEVINFGVPERKLVYIQNAVNLKEVDVYFEKRRHTDEVKLKKTIGFVGQMIERKQIAHILDIFNALWRDDKNIELVLLGDGAQRQQLEEYAQTLPCIEAVSFLGFRTDRLDIMLNFDLFVMTSSSEGIPRCLMEAVAMGIPVAAYGITGIDQLITHEETGLLADFGEKDTLGRYWRKLLDEPTYASELTKNGRKFVLDNFSSERMAREYLELFEALVQGKTALDHSVKNTASPPT